MSYTPNTWAAGDTVTAAKLNSLEQGVADAGNITIIEATYDSNSGLYTLDATANNVWQACQNGIVLVKSADGTGYIECGIITVGYINENGYNFQTEYRDFFASSGTDYPSNAQNYT